MTPASKMVLPPGHYQFYITVCKKMLFSYSELLAEHQSLTQEPDAVAEPDAVTSGDIATPMEYNSGHDIETG